MKKFWRRNNKFTIDNEQLTTKREKAESLLFTLSITFCQLSILMLLTMCSQKKHAHAEQYTCPMHPTVIKDQPGTCPICGMDLVLKGKRGDEKIADDLNYLLHPVNASVLSSIKTITPEKKGVDIKAQANGIITYDTRATTIISSRISGRIERLFVKYNFQPIKKGQKVLEIYSPELLTAQRDLLYLLKSDRENSQLIEGAKEKLRLLGATDYQIDQLVSTGKESASFAIYSQTEGYIVNSGEDQNNQSELEVREGMYVSAGQAIFKVASAKTVWAEFDLYSKDVSLVKVNDPIQMTIGEEEFNTKIDFVEPFYKKGENFTKVRVYLSNPNGNYRIGQLVSASLDKSSREALWIPVMAQLDLGTEKVVFIRRKKTFQPVEVTTGNQSDNLIEVLKGIDASDSIAYNAQFMIDSESFIKTKN